MLGRSFKQERLFLPLTHLGVHPFDFFGLVHWVEDVPVGVDQEYNFFSRTSILPCDIIILVKGTQRACQVESGILMVLTGCVLVTVEEDAFYPIDNCKSHMLILFVWMPL
ncbi:hypothetical protein GOP47_0025531 [Adiantum capillus-veneris]|uniref:Uncharacterized protein n=1 Tax=Adiantum capillus-veneris TaxID=13818 RepID=A0A9D4Z3M7_ADICA|nr:hypothetical protein GOP47_0025531 [Adiantum capillus-veneris]